MKGSIQPKSGRRRTACAEEAAFLELLRTCDLLSRGPAQVLKVEDLSATQYNVLRILRGAPEGLQLLARLDAPVEDSHRKQLGHLGRERLRALTELLHACRTKVS